MSKWAHIFIALSVYIELERNVKLWYKPFICLILAFTASLKRGTNSSIFLNKTFQIEVTDFSFLIDNDEDLCWAKKDR